MACCEGVACVCSYLINGNSRNRLLTCQPYGCIDDPFRDHARAPRAVRPTPVRRRPQDLLEPATAKRSQTQGSLGDDQLQVKGHFVVWIISSQPCSPEGKLLTEGDVRSRIGSAQRIEADRFPLWERRDWGK